MTTGPGPGQPRPDILLTHFMDLMNIPNIITLARILSVPALIWFILAGQYSIAFLIFMLAGISDGVDGFLAKRFGWKTELGAYLDAVADKTLLVSIFIALGIIGLLPAWIVIGVVARDLLIIGAVLLSWILENPVTIKPSYVSKVNTTAQILLAGLVLANAGFNLDLHGVIAALVLVVAILTLWSAFDYMLTWLKHMTNTDRE